MHKAVDEMGSAATFHGYAPDLGYEFLRKAISDNDYKARGCDISADEIFVSDGAKSDSRPTSRSFSQQTAVSLLQILFTLYMLIPMSWQEEQAHMTLRKRPGAM